MTGARQGKIYWARLLTSAYRNEVWTRVREDQIPVFITDLVTAHGEKAAEYACILLEQHPTMDCRGAVEQVERMLSDAGQILFTDGNLTDWLRMQVVGPVIQDATDEHGLHSVVGAVDWEAYVQILIDHQEIIVLPSGGGGVTVYAGPRLQKGSALWTSP